MASSSGPAGSSLFLTEEEHQEVRALTTLLSYTEFTIGGKEVPLSGYLKTPTESEDARTQWYKILCSLLNAITRGGNEVAALIPGPIAMTGTLDLFLSRNPQRTNWPADTGRSKPTGPRLEARIEQYTVPENVEKDVVRGYVDLQGRFKYEIPYDVVAKTFVHLLRVNHKASSPQQENNTFTDLVVYTLMTGLGRMTARIHTGKEERNFFLYLTMADEQCADENEVNIMTRTKAARSPETAQELIDRFRKHRKLMKSPEADATLKETLSDRLPTDEQKVVMKTHFIQNRGLMSEDCLKKPLFDKHGRRRMWRAVAGVLAALVRDVDRVKKTLKVKSPGPHFHITHVYVETLRKALLKLKRDLEFFYDVIHIFKDEIQNILKWIREYCDLKQSTLPTRQLFSHNEEKLLKSSSLHLGSSSPPQSPILGKSTSGQLIPSSPPLAIKKQPQSSPQKQPISSDVPSYGSSSPVKFSSPQKLPQFDVEDEKEKLEILMQADKQMRAMQLQISDEATELGEITNDVKRGWHLAAWKWLHLITLHFEALEILRLDSRHPSQTAKETLKGMVPRIKFHTLELSGQRQLITQSLNAAIESAVHKTIHSENLKTWLKIHTDEHVAEKGIKSGYAHVANVREWDNLNFTGTWHCETIALTLHALSLPGVMKGLKEDLKARQEQISGILKQNGVLVPPELIARFGSIGAMLAVSKRCCPACNVIVEWIKDKKTGMPGDQLIYPGYHTVWFPTTLPPWTPRQAGQRLLTQARQELTNRAEKIHILTQENKKVRKRTPSMASLPPLSPTRMEYLSSGMKRTKYDDPPAEAVEDEEQG